jgi:hypothetical protein
VDGRVATEGEGRAPGASSCREGSGGTGLGDGEREAMMAASGPPWSVGDRVMFATFDHEDADTRDADGTMGTVRAVADDPFDWIEVYSDFYFEVRGWDPFCFISEAEGNRRLGR